MKRIIIIALCLLLAAFPALGEVDMETLEDCVRGGLAEGVELVKLELDERVLSIVVDLSGVEELYDGFRVDLATDATSAITDGLMDYAELDGEWDVMFVEMSGIGYFFFSPDDVRTNEYGMRYLPVYDEDYNSLITLDGAAPNVPADQPLDQAVRAYIDGEFSHSETDYITVNPNYGTADPDDTIVLPHIVFTGGEENRALIQPLSDSLATYLSENYPNVQELCIFWERPSDKSVAEKRAYERKGGALSPTDVMQAQKFD